MKPTNDTVKVELQHMPTGDMIAWKHCGHYVPVEVYLGKRLEAERLKYQQIVNENGLPRDEAGSVDYSGLEDESALSKLNDINQQILTLQMDALCSVLQPVYPLPEGYINRRQLLEECIGSYEVIPQVMNFFSQHSSSSITSQEAGSGHESLIRFRGADGEEIQMPDMKRQTEAPGGNSSTG